MGKGDKYRFFYDPLTALRNAPKLMGMDLKPCGPNKLCGGYYMDRQPHPFRRDKIKVYLWKGAVLVSEEGGKTMSLPNWLIQFGGANDFMDALRMINGENQAIQWNQEFRQKARPKVQYVSADVLEGAKAYDLNLSPLFRYMVKLFGEDRVRKVWDAYNVTATSKGGTCFWYLNKDGKICHDKVVWYDDTGHRIKTLPMGRKYRVGDGFSENPVFGAHFKKKPKGLLESEKSALYASCYYGGVWLACGGKSNLHDPGDVPLYADRDAEEAWSRCGSCVDWYSDWPECGEQSDLGDKIEWIVLRNKK